jgi:hypothetical protein
LQVIPSFLLLAAGELAVPVWAERSGQPTAWHPGHIAEHSATRLARTDLTGWLRHPQLISNTSLPQQTT